MAGGKGCGRWMAGGATGSDGRLGTMGGWGRWWLWVFDAGLFFVSQAWDSQQKPGYVSLSLRWISRLGFATEARLALRMPATHFDDQQTRTKLIAD